MAQCSPADASRLPLRSLSQQNTTPAAAVARTDTAAHTHNPVEPVPNQRSTKGLACAADAEVSPLVQEGLASCGQQQCHQVRREDQPGRDPAPPQAAADAEPAQAQVGGREPVPTGEQQEQPGHQQVDRQGRRRGDPVVEHVGRCQQEHGDDERHGADSIRRRADPPPGGPGRGTYASGAQSLGWVPWRQDEEEKVRQWVSRPSSSAAWPW